MHRITRKSALQPKFMALAWHQISRPTPSSAI
jgi:hypothetical protein